jgi:MFS family permease
MTAAIGGIVSLPLPFLLGWLSDKVGRKAIMITSPLAGAACLLLLLVSRTLWQFSAVAVLNSIMAVSISVGPAMVADVVRRERVGTGISLFQSSVWIGMIIGFSFTGIAFQRLGLQIGLELGALCTFLAIPLFLLVRTTVKTPPGQQNRARRQPASTTARMSSSPQRSFSSSTKVP